jgi:ethanolamine utilization protein EutN
VEILRRDGWGTLDPLTPRTLESFFSEAPFAFFRLQNLNLSPNGSRKNMFIGRVVGTMVSEINDIVYDNRKILVLDRLTPEGDPDGSYVLAVDSVDAGIGQVVLYIDEGNSARQVVGIPNAAIRTVIVGIVDEVKVEEQEVWRPQNE